MKIQSANSSPPREVMDIEREQYIQERYPLRHQQNDSRISFVLSCIESVMRWIRNG